MPGAAFQAMVELIAMEARFAGASVQTAASAPRSAAAAASAGGRGGGAVSAAVDNSYSFTLLGLADNAMLCLHDWCTKDGEPVIAQSGPGLLRPELLRRIACHPECPSPGDAVTVVSRLSILHSLATLGTDELPLRMVALRHGAGDEMLEFCLAGIRHKLAPEPAAAAGGTEGCRRARRAAVAAVSGTLAESDSPHHLSGTMDAWFSLLGTLVGLASDNEAIRVRLLQQAVDGGTASLVLTALEAAAHVPGPAGADFRIGANGFTLLSVLTKGDHRCWREAVFEDALPDSAICARRPAWAAGSGEAQAGRAPPWIISVAVAALKKTAARQPLLEDAWFVSPVGHDAFRLLRGLGFGKSVSENSLDKLRLSHPAKFSFN